jgi:hypothetical protein
VSANLPLQLDQATSAKVHRRAELALEAEFEVNVTLAYTPEHDLDQLRKEYALGAYRWALRQLGSVPAVEEVDVSEFDDDAIAAGTPVPRYREAGEP